MGSGSKASSGSVAKRVLVGRAFSSHHLEHTLLPKILALPVFASDALSSVAYATGEILIALTLATTVRRKYVMPISFAIAALMAIVVSSYRQTVRAYPSGGGAYIVSKENLGTFAGLVAAAALSFDYMMTVVVSIVAGVFAIGSAFPWATEHKVLLSIVFVALVTVANLRGARESGTLFAIPTYGFVVSILILVAVGAVRCVGGCPAVVPPSPQHRDAGGGRGHHASSCCSKRSHRARPRSPVSRRSRTACRRSNGRRRRTPRRPSRSWARSRSTMFLGISYLATHIPGLVASEERSAVAQIAVAIFGNNTFGFYHRAGVHRGDPGPRGEHRLSGLPAPRVDPRRATGSCRVSS